MKTLAAMLMLAGCAVAPAAPVEVTGDWGGAHVGLHLTAAGGTLDYDCASGTIGPVLPAPDGRFVAQGTHTPGHGGPERQGEILPVHAASYAGTVRGDRMTLQGRLDNGVELGPFTLARGAEPGIFRCL